MEDSNCGTQDLDMDDQDSRSACEAAVIDAGGAFYIYKEETNKCYKENAYSKVCDNRPLLAQADYDLYQIDGITQVALQLQKGKKCTADTFSLGKKDTLRECLTAVSDAGGNFFIYGTGSNAKKCRIKSTALDTCPEGFKGDHYDFYEVKAVTENGGSTLIQENVTCKTILTSMGDQDSLGECETAVKNAGGAFYTYGHGSKEKECFKEEAYSNCNENPWTGQEYNYYQIDGITHVALQLQTGKECASTGTDLGEKNTLRECLTAVINESETFFIYGNGTGTSAKSCWTESTKVDTCPEGWRDNGYDFYEVKEAGGVAGAKDSGSTLIETGSTCTSADISMGYQYSLSACETAVKNAGGAFYIFGYGSKDKECFKEETYSTCREEEFKTGEDYDFYQIDGITHMALLLHKGKECSSHNQGLGNKNTLRECLTAVRAGGGTYFLYGTNTKSCWIEITALHTCPEGLKDNADYDFYEVKKVSSAQRNSILVSRSAELQMSLLHLFLLVAMVTSFLDTWPF